MTKKKNFSLTKTKRNKFGKTRIVYVNKKYKKNNHFN